MDVSFLVRPVCCLFGNNIKKVITMVGMYVILGGVGLIACLLYLWSSYTKSGKKWIESL